MSSCNARIYFKCLRRKFGVGIICGGVLSSLIIQAVMICRMIVLTNLSELDSHFSFTS